MSWRRSALRISLGQTPGVTPNDIKLKYVINFALLSVNIDYEPLETSNKLCVICTNANAIIYIILHPFIFWYEYPSNEEKMLVRPWKK